MLNIGLITLSTHNSFPSIHIHTIWELKVMAKAIISFYCVIQGSNVAAEASSPRRRLHL